MTLFIISLIILIGGYFVYGLLAERIFGADTSRTTPAYTMNDGVDYMPMPAWRVFLIQFLNIAGLGPIFGGHRVRPGGFPVDCNRHHLRRCGT